MRSAEHWDDKAVRATEVAEKMTAPEQRHAMREIAARYRNLARGNGRHGARRPGKHR